MDSIYPTTSNWSFDYRFVALGIVIGIVIAAGSYFIITRRNTTPLGAEGFYGGVSRGAGLPLSSYSSAESSALVSIFIDKGVMRKEEGRPDLEEFILILSKMAALQKDVQSPSHIVNATRGIPFSTHHDREAVADTAARCFNKTIPQRDLEISLETWKDRGTHLLKRLCVTANLNNSELENVEGLFKTAWTQCRDVSRSHCIEGVPTIVGEPQPRQPREWTPLSLNDLGAYKEAPWN